MTNPTVSLDGVAKTFDDEPVLDGLTLQVEPGTILGLIGPSGCGKTTAVRLVAGTYVPDAGEIRTLGRDPRSLSLRDRQRIGYLPQQPVLFDALTLRGNLDFHASLNGVRVRRGHRRDEMLELVDLRGHESKRASEASGGMRRRLALAATLMHRPDLVLLDEPTAGIDPVLRARFWEHFRTLAAEDGAALIVTTQYVGEAAYCDEVGLLADGGLVHLGPPAELRRAAYGGDVGRIVTSDPVPEDELVALARDNHCTLEREAPTTVRVVLQDGADLADVVAAFERARLRVVEKESVVVDYDEAFVRLVEQRRAGVG